jgi:hypothetical protein
MRETKTRGDLLAFAISSALIGASKVVRGLSLGLGDKERHAVAGRADEEMKKYGDPWKLNEDLPMSVAAGPPQSQMQSWTRKADKKEG